MREGDVMLAKVNEMKGKVSLKGRTEIKDVNREIKEAGRKEMRLSNWVH